MAEYVPLQYPKMLYHQDGRTVIVADTFEHTDMGDDWAESPDGPWPTRAAPKKAAAKKAARGGG